MEELTVASDDGNRARRVALYARVSTDDEDQDPETQIHALRIHCERRGWTIEGDPYVDFASAKDLARREAWRLLMRAASRGEFDIVLVYRLDRAFRSVRDGVLALDQLKPWGVGFVSVEEPYIDTTSPMGELMFTISAAWARLEGEIIGQRVRAGIERARAQGIKLGRPTVPVDIECVVRQRAAGLSRALIHRGHPAMKMDSGQREKPSVTTIGNAYLSRSERRGELPRFAECDLQRQGSSEPRARPS